MFSRFFIDRPIFASVVSIFIVILGLVALPTLPIEQTPNITPPTVEVSTFYPGASPAVIAETVAFPIETEVNGVDDMIYMSSKCGDDGSYSLTVTFEVGTDIDMAQVLVQNRVAIAEPKLPEDVKRQGVTTKKRSTNLVMVVNLVGQESVYDELYQSNYLNTQIVDVLKRVQGVGDVVVFGAKDFGMRIWVDPERLRARGLTTSDVLAAVREQNIQVAAGQIGAPPAPPDTEFTYTINTLGRLSSAAEFERVVVKIGDDGQIVRLGDVARLELGAESYKWSMSLNGEPSIGVGIYQLPGANALDVADGVLAEMERMKQAFPPGLDYRIAFETTRFVTASIDEVVETLFIAVLLVVLTVYVFLQDFRTTLVPAATIPVSLIGTLFVMKIIGLSINTLSLFGIVLAIGIVVDDAIVVVENVMRIIDEEKLSAREATAKAMGQISGPIVATTLVLLAVFVPTALISGITGRLYQQFAITISVATVFSSVNALTLSPALCGMLLRPTPEKKNAVFRAFDAFLDRCRGGYVGTVGFLVRRLALSALLFLGVLGLTGFGMVKLPTGFIPDEDQGYYFAQAILPEGASLQRSETVIAELDEFVRGLPGVADTLSIGGYSFLDGVVASNAASLIVVLDHWADRQEVERGVFEVVGRTNAHLLGYQPAFGIAFSPPPITGLGTAGGFEFQLQDRQGVGSVLLETVAMDVLAAGFADPVLTRLNNNFRSATPQLFLEVDREKVKRLGIPLAAVFETLQAALGSMYVNDFNIFGRTYKVMLQADAEFRDQVDDVRRLEVRSASGEMVPLSTLVTIEDTVGPRTIFRYNNYPSATLTGSAAPGFSSGQAIQAMESIASTRLPGSMGFEWSGVTYQQIQAGNQAPFIFAMALVFVFLFLAAQYESWSTPLAVIFSVPFALLGAVAFTALRQFDNNVYTQIGFVMLIGLSAKNAILIVEFAKQKVDEEGADYADAAVEGSGLRFRAILMTAFSFILGVLPLVVASGAGANSRQSLGTAVAGGMGLATVVGIFFIPTLYVLVMRLFARRRRAPQPAAAPQAT